MVAVYDGSYLSADKYMYKVVDWPSDLHAFFFQSLRTNPLFICTPPFLGIFTCCNQFVQLKVKIFYFVRIIRNSTSSFGD